MGERKEHVFIKPVVKYIITEELGIRAHIAAIHVKKGAKRGSTVKQAATQACSLRQACKSFDFISPFKGGGI